MPTSCPPLVDPGRGRSRSASGGSLGSRRIVSVHLTVWESLPESQPCWRFRILLRASAMPQHRYFQEPQSCAVQNLEGDLPGCGGSVGPLSRARHFKPCQAASGHRHMQVRKGSPARCAQQLSQLAASPSPASGPAQVAAHTLPSLYLASWQPRLPTSGSLGPCLAPGATALGFAWSESEHEWGSQPSLPGLSSTAAKQTMLTSESRDSFSRLWDSIQEPGKALRVPTMGRRP